MNPTDTNINQPEIAERKSTAVYLRLSGAEILQMPARQEYEVRQFCSARGWSDVEIYFDKAMVKSSQPALHKMMQRLRDGLVRRAVFHSLSAFGSLTNLCLVVEEINHLEVPIICVSEDLDTSDVNCAKTLAAFCQFRRSLYRERVNSGLKSARKKGKRLGRPATLHKHRDDVMELRRQGVGLRQIASQLKMPPSSVYKIIKNEEKN
jgi:DNA invertase Pin-like site-specific DNA recombinase